MEKTEGNEGHQTPRPKNRAHTVRLVMSGTRWWYFIVADTTKWYQLRSTSDSQHCSIKNKQPTEAGHEEATATALNKLG